MPATFPAAKAENWLDGVILQPSGEADAGDLDVPRFALIETHGPDPLAMILSPIILTSLLFAALALEHLPPVAPTPVGEAVTMLVAPPEPPTLPDIAAMKSSSEGATLSPTAKVIAPDPPPPERPESQPPPIKVERISADSITATPVPPEIPEKPTPRPIQSEPVLSSVAAQVIPAVATVPKPMPATIPPDSVNKRVAHDLKPEADTADPTRGVARDVPRRVPESLGGLPLSQLIEEQDGLAAGLAALPSSERLGLPRVSIRVNAEWLEALPKTQERLYFSITAPQPDREVLAYLPNSHSFDLERPEHPLWKIHDGERVPALAELRTEAGQWLGVSPELVGLYTWHPPVFEDALRMFVLERMQELRVHLGPRDVVTVRLIPGSAGAVMNLEPIHQEASIN